MNHHSLEIESSRQVSAWAPFWIALYRPISSIQRHTSEARFVWESIQPEPTPLSNTMYQLPSRIHCDT